MQKSITLNPPSKRNRYDGLHIETQHGTVNIDLVTDPDTGLWVTHVAVLPDGNRFLGEETHMPGFGEQLATTGFGVRFMSGKFVPFDFDVKWNNVKGSKKVITIDYRHRLWALEFHVSEGSWYYSTLKSDKPAVSLFLGEFRRVGFDNPNFWPNIYEEFTAKAKTALLNLYALTEGN